MTSQFIRTVLVFVASGLALQAAEPRGIFATYAENRRQAVPNYITEDLLLLSYGMLLDDAIASTEQKTAYPEMKQLVEGLLKKDLAPAH